jgi:hypothetical protein
MGYRLAKQLVCDLGARIYRPTMPDDLLVFATALAYDATSWHRYTTLDVVCATLI